MQVHHYTLQFQRIMQTYVMPIMFDLEKFSILLVAVSVLETHTEKVSADIFPIGIALVVPP